MNYVASADLDVHARSITTATFNPATGEMTTNSHLRKLVVESAWHYAKALPKRKYAPNPEVPLSIENHATKATAATLSRQEALYCQLRHRTRAGMLNVGNRAHERGGTVGEDLSESFTLFRPLHSIGRWR